MKIPTICRYCGGKIIKSTTRALYPKGSEPIYLCVNCNAYVGCYPDGSPMGKVANTVLRLKRQETHRIFDRFWREQGWTCSPRSRLLRTTPCWGSKAASSRLMWPGPLRRHERG